MLSNIAFFLLAPALIAGGVVLARRVPFGRRPSGALPVWALVALPIAICMYAVALLPLFVFLIEQRGHPEYQSYYYSSLRVLGLTGWAGTLAAVGWESIRVGPSWAALCIAGWATLSFFSCLIATMFMVAVQV